MILLLCRLIAHWVFVLALYILLTSQIFLLIKSDHSSYIIALAQNGIQNTPK